MASVIEAIHRMSPRDAHEHPGRVEDAAVAAVPHRVSVRETWQRADERGRSVEINPAAPATASEEILIKADPETVFSVTSAIEAWPSWNPAVSPASIEGPVEPGTTFKWMAASSSLRSVLRVVDPPHEIGWTGRAKGIRAVHVFRFEPCEGGTLARSEESWEGPIPRALAGWSQRTVETGTDDVLSRLKAESERRAAEA